MNKSRPLKLPVSQGLAREDLMRCVYGNVYLLDGHIVDTQQMFVESEICSCQPKKVKFVVSALNAPSRAKENIFPPAASFPTPGPTPYVPSRPKTLMGLLFAATPLQLMCPCRLSGEAHWVCWVTLPTCPSPMLCHC